MVDQVPRNEELLTIARDYFHFVTKFFEPINVSATHIYHSALELSPLPSIIRRLYYHRHHTSLPRMIVGNEDSWDPWLVVSWDHDCDLCTWSPCGRFIATGSEKGVEIRDPLSFELFSTLMPTEPTQKCRGKLAYSMDGHSVASVFGTLLIIWDIQTGGVAKNKECWGGCNICLAWSLDGSTIGIISSKSLKTYTVYKYDLASGAMRFLGELPSGDEPHLWAHDASFRVMTTSRGHWSCTINIFEVGSVITEVKSFHIASQEFLFGVKSFSQTTYRISISGATCRTHSSSVFIFDARTSRCLLEGKHLKLHCFSPDGSLFAGISENAVHIWKYTSDDYTPWREFPLQDSFFGYYSLQFSPTSSSLLACSNKSLQLWRLDDHPIVPHPDHRAPPLITLSQCGSYMATGRRADSIVTITNLLSQTSSHPIDTGMPIDTLALTGNVLLVLDSTTIAAWRLTEEGAVDGVFANGRVDRGYSVWTISLQSRYCDLRFLVGDEAVAIRQGGQVTHVYRTETGEMFKPSQTSLYPHCNYTSWCMLRGLHYRSSRPAPQNIIQTGWMKDPEGGYRLWIPFEWRNSPSNVILLGDSKALRFDTYRGKPIIIKF